MRRAMIAETASVRKPAVAGLFYPGNTTELRDQVDGLLEGVDSTEQTGGVTKAVIAPHAGYVYSGAVAASALAAFAAQSRSIRRIVLLGPAHRVSLRGLALPGCDFFETPLGRTPVDLELTGRVAEFIQVTTYPEAHAEEHALEVELPFLQVLLEDFSLLPLVVGEASPQEVAEVLDAVWGGEETRIVVSSDLSHYLPYDRACEKDRHTADQIVRLEGPVAPQAACGARPINGLLALAKSRQLEVDLIDLRNSGDTAGDRDRVVGYGAFHFCQVRKSS